MVLREQISEKKTKFITWAERATGNLPPKKLTRLQVSWRFLKRAFHLVRKGIYTTAKYATVLGVSLITFNVILIQFAFYQTLLFNQVAHYFSEKLQYNITFKSAYVDIISARLRFEDLKVIDRQQRPLLDAHELVIGLDYYKMLNDGNIRIESLKLRKTLVNFAVDKNGKLNLNDFIDKIDALTPPRDPNKKKEPSEFRIIAVKLDDVNFNYLIETKTRLNKQAFDPSHIEIQHINAEVKDLRNFADTTEMQIKQLKAWEKNAKLNLKNLTVDFRLTDQSMEFQKLLLEANNTKLTNHLVFRFKDIGDLSDFVEKVNIDARLRDTQIDTDDIALFADALEKYKNDLWKIDANFKGKVSDFVLQNADIRLGRMTRFQIPTLKMKGLPNPDALEIDLALQSPSFWGQDIAVFLDNPTLTDLLNKLGKAQLEADFKGTTQQFETQLALQSEAGNLETIANIDLSKENYKANLTTENLNLGELLNDPTFGKANLKAEIEGQGFSQETAHFALDAQVSTLDFNAYTYQDIQIDGEFAKNHFEGDFISKDKNLDLDIIGEIDFNKNNIEIGKTPGKFDFQANFRHIDLQKLNFSPDELILVGKLNADMNGLDLDSLDGKVSFREGFLVYKGKHLDLRDLQLNAGKTNQNKQKIIEIVSDFIKIKLAGSFFFSELFQDIPTILNEYMIAFRNNAEEIEKYYQQKNKKQKTSTPPRPYALEYVINVNNINPVLALFLSNAHISHNEEIKGRFDKNQHSTFNLFTNKNNSIDTLSFGSNYLFNTDININARQKGDTAQVFSKVQINSQKQRFSDTHTEQMLLLADWHKNKIDFEAKIQQADSSGNYADLLGTLTLESEFVKHLNFKPSHFSLLKEKWAINEHNEILLDEDKIEFINLDFHKVEDPSSKILMEGLIAEKINEPLRISIENIDIKSFTNLFGINLSGLLNGEFLARKLYQTPEIDSDFTLENITMDNDFLIGDVFAKLQWNSELNRFIIDAELDRMRNDVLDIDGHIDPNDTKNALNLDIVLKNTDLVLIEPFTVGILSDVSGAAKGKLTLRGELTKPNVLGMIEFVNGSLRVDYLNTVYTFNDRIYFEPNAITFKSFFLTDENKRKLSLNGQLNHDGFTNILADLEGNYKNFMFLDKPEQKGELFYGKAFATGNVKIFGLLNELNIDVTAKNEKNTKLFLPLESGNEEVQQSDYIIFVTKDEDKDSVALSTTAKELNLGGLSLNFNLDVNPEAKLEIIFDKKAGDIIKVEGNGQIEMKVTPQGDLTMLGQYNITKGKYNFTLMNLVNKGFDIMPGSRITFAGDVYETLIDVTARYRQRVSLSPLVDKSSVSDPENPTYNTRVFVDALMQLKGNMLQPEIALGLDLKEAKLAQNSTLQQAVADLESKVAADEQERNRQVFSLILMQSLAPPNSFGGVGTGATGSLSELLSNQLSSWISQVDENLEVNLNIEESRVRVRYSLFNNRLLITRDGSFSNDNSANAAANAIGDWTVEYMLTVDGKLRAKVYNRNNQNPLGTFNLNNQNSSTTAGISLVYSQSFNKLKELFDVKFKEDKNDDDSAPKGK